MFISNAAGALKLDMDVRFKVNDLDLTPYLSGPLRHGGGGEEGGAPVFNLYGCVCHFGSGEPVIILKPSQCISRSNISHLCQLYLQCMVVTTQRIVSTWGPDSGTTLMTAPSTTIR